MSDDRVENRSSAETNPYEAPQAQSVRESSGDSGPILRQSLVVLVAVLAIPPALIVAFFIACFATGIAAQSIELGLVAGVIASIAALVCLLRLLAKYRKQS
jgi:hypothetical protein